MNKRWLILPAILAVLSLLLALRPVIYQINPNHCFLCGHCIMHCPTGAIQFDGHTGMLFIDSDLCNGCGACVPYCPYGAIYQVTGDGDDTVPVPKLTLQCHPNPFNTTTDFTIKLPSEKEQADLSIFNSKGKLVYRTSLQGTDLSLRWFGTNSQGRKLPAGIYLAKVTCGNQHITKKITLVSK